MSDEGPNDGPDYSGISYLNAIGKLVGEAAEYVLHAAEIARLKLEALEPPPLPPPPMLNVDAITTASGQASSQLVTRPTRRGVVVPLTAAQRRMRMLYLAEAAEIFSLDPFVRRAGALLVCPDIFYLLKDHNGGKDPTASDPADRWSKPGSTFVNRTCDCIGGMCWCGGWDRYQPIRFAHIYSGWINTDSMMMECDRVARGELPHIAPCFRRLSYPVEGCYVVCRSGSRGHAVGHIGGCVEVPVGLDLSKRDSWDAIKVVDVASRSPKKANAFTTARGWFDTGTYFVEPIMAADPDMLAA